MTERNLGKTRLDRFFRWLSPVHFDYLDRRYADMAERAKELVKGWKKLQENAEQRALRYPKNKGLRQQAERYRTEVEEAIADEKEAESKVFRIPAARKETEK